MTDLESPKEILKKYFGYDSFRPMQEEVINNLLNNQDTLLLMPTGGGKSLCFQIPALAKEGTALVISPLIALMKDQVQALKANGVEAEYINSTLSISDIHSVKEKCRNGKLKLLYIAPETLVRMRDNFLNEVHVSMIAIDEAHCISQWGHDFRPEYKQLQFLKKKFPHAPVIALTATADKITRKDITTQLQIEHAKVFISSFDRANLTLTVRKGVNSKQRMSEIESLAMRYKNDAGIIYCLSKKTTENVAEKLMAAGIKCAYYHGGMEAASRNNVQEAFIRDDVKVMVATIAFGMGIDKSNVRYVVHYNMPKNMESYYQEIGRAGRDGLKSETVFYYNISDLIMLQQFADASGQRELNTQKLKLIQEYAEAGICRRKILLNYFSESITQNCGNCDVCLNPPRYIDGTLTAQKALSAISRMDEKASFNMLINVLRGSRNGDVLERGYDKIKTYGAGKELSFEMWQSYLMQMLQLGLIEIAYDESYSLKVTAFGKQVLFGKSSIHFVQATMIDKKQKKYKSSLAPLATVSESPDNLFEELRQLRKDFSVQTGFAPYIIFSDATLNAMVTYRPTNEAEMLNITGVSQNKMDKYGKEFLKAIHKEKTNFTSPPKANFEDILGDKNIEKYVNEMRKKGVRLSHAVLGKALVGNERNANDEAAQSLSFFGVLHGVVKYNAVGPVLLAYFNKHVNREMNAEVEQFFSASTFNHLTANARMALQTAISLLPIERTAEAISEKVQQLRKIHYRSHEPWSQKEIQYFKRSIAQTNDLQFLSIAFGRSESSLEAVYKKMVLENVEPDNEN